jgi:hypothetical protein
MYCVSQKFIYHTIVIEECEYDITPRRLHVQRTILSLEHVEHKGYEGN